MTRSRWVWLPILCVAACSGPETSDFQADLSSPPTPWTHERFDEGPGQFTFAIFSDLNGGEREGVFSVAAAQLALLRPELVISVGDLIDGPTQDADELAREWESFDSRASVIPAPVFYVGGNHDLTGQALRDVDFPKNGVVGTILRGDEIILPRGEDVLHPGDDVIVFAMPDAIPAVEALFD